ncbi:LysR substrate-binding domain-containing protein [Alterinioella nitratireducens]|uniref:LysR substrate-binding domain-containing protein n=1 Tax=Alterinioella nitratireducens TaxID=2735915 RepID=UPI004057F824
MTLEQLRIFLEVARCEHVTRAAARLNLTQSAVSAAVTALEKRHLVTLFNRIGRGIELTAEGRSFVAEAEAVLSRAGEAEQVLEDLVKQPSGPLRIGASQTVASYWLPGRLMSFHEAYPRVALHLTSGNTETVARGVSAGTVDLGIVEGDVDDLGLEVHEVASDHISLVVGPEHNWSDGHALDITDLKRTSWVMRERGSGTRADFERYIGQFGLDPDELDVVLELPSNEACLAAVRTGQAATVLSRRAVELQLDADFRQAGFTFPPRRFRVLRDPRRYLSRACRAMLDLLMSRPREGVP